MTDFALLSAWIESQVAYRGWPGLSIAVVHDGNVRWTQGFGAGTPATRYRVASITKTFTATAVLQLRDAGKLRLDDEVRSHLPWFTPKSGFGEAPPITIRHLITHTAGLPREAPFPYWSDGNFPGLEAIRGAIAAQDCVLPTETRWKYSNLAVVVAGEVVSAVSGMAWGDYVKTHVLEPLGMRDTLVDAPAADDPKLARPYARRLPSGERPAAPHTDTRGITAAAGLTTTVEDLARFVLMQLGDGTPVLRGSTLREMQRAHWLEPDWTAGWGLGFHLYRAHGRTLVGHAGVLRGYRSELRFCPAEKLGVIVLINADDGEPRAVVDKAFEWLAPALRRSDAPTAPAAPDPAWERYVGRYRNGFTDLQVLVTGGRLTLIMPGLPDPSLIAAALEPAGEHTFRIESADGFSSHGERVVFELDGAGRVARMRIGPNYAEPVSAW